MRGAWSRTAVALAVLGLAAALPAQDVTIPAEVQGVTLSRSGDDVVLAWGDVTEDVTGNAETIANYHVYRGDSHDFLADRTGGTNRIGTPAAASHPDPGAATDGTRLHYYLVSAEDAAGNEGNVRRSRVTTPPTLASFWTPATVELGWMGTEPRAEVTGYKVYWGRGSATYEEMAELGPTANLHSLTALVPDTLYWAAVTGLDREGNESDFTNEIADAIAGTFTIDGIVEGHITPSGHTVREEVDLPPPSSDWTRVTLIGVCDSRLSIPCDCSGDGSCGGDPWDRTWSVFMEDEGGTRWELMHAITPFGTDAETGPRRLEMDVTPLAPILTGRVTLGSSISTWVGNGWYVDVALEFTKDPALASPKPPADGVVPLFYRNVNPGNQDDVEPANVTIPANANEVYIRLFVSGHGGGDPAGDPDCIGPKDEFCMRNTQIQVDTVPVWQDVVWWDCPDNCGKGPNPGVGWNACGWSSCQFPRAGWCPGLITCHDPPFCDQDLDMTASLPAGGSYDVRYYVTNIGAGSTWSYSLVLYWYR